MYSDRVIQQNIDKYEAKAGHKLLFIPNAERDSWREYLESQLAKYESLEEFLPKLSDEARLFIRNERVLSTLSFKYWSHYATIERDGGGITNFDNPWESTCIFLRFVAGIEEELYDAIERGEMTAIMTQGQDKPAVPGILIAINKARQTAATTIGRLITMHRLTTQNQRRGLAASVSDSRVKIMYDRDKLCYDNLPFYLKPELKYDEKCAHMHFEGLNSRVDYQVSSQKSGSGTDQYGSRTGTSAIGVGSQVDIHHFTELSTWFSPESLELDFFPAIPRSIHTFGLLESTPFGVGNWWNSWTESLRLHGDDRWRYIFIPWYAEPSKYRALPPTDWSPSEISLLHAQKVFDTSMKYVGKKIILARENLYWWEVNRNKAKEDQRLHFFLTNYAASPEESFQQTALSAFDPDFLAELWDRSTPGTSYEIISV